MHKQRLAVVITGALGVVGTFLPWVSVLFFSFNGLNTWHGYAVLAASAGAMAMAFMGDRTQAIDADKVKIVAGAGAVAFAVSLIALFSLMGSGATGIGIYLSLIAGLATLAVPFVIKDSGEISMPTKDSIVDEFNEMKDN